MKTLRMQLIALLAVASCTPSIAEISQAEKSEINAMHWMNAIGSRLEASKSQIVNLPDYRVVLGPEARRLRLISDPGDDANANYEADAYDKSGSELVYEWFPSGFVTSDDWSDVDADKFLAQIQENDAAANKIRLEKGVPTLTTTGWRQKPVLDQRTHTVFWSTKLSQSDGTTLVNSVALKLGRSGFERIVWITDPLRANGRDELSLAVNNHQFDNGAGYTDYKPGQDRVAEYGVAGLVASALGVHLAAKFGLIALFAAFAKKAGVLIFLAIAGIGGWVKRLLSRKSRTATLPSVSIGSKTR
jgi:uncharacterized membrane-anchored protein